MSRQAVVAAFFVFALSTCSSSPKHIDAMSVRGRAVGMCGSSTGAPGTPVVNAQVQVGTRPAVTTDGDGAFGVDDVVAPYDVVLVSPGFTIGNVTSAIALYQGLTRSDPTISAAYGVPFDQSATVTGTITGPPLQKVGVVLSTELFESTCNANATTGTYECKDMRWYGPAFLAGKLRALSWNEDASGVPSEYTGFAERNVGLTSGTTSSVDLALASVGEASVSGTISAPPAVAVSWQGLDVGFADPPARLFVYSAATTATSFSYVVPTIPGAFAAISAESSAAGASTRTSRVLPAASASGVQVELSAIPALTEPADAATDVAPGTVLRWTAVPNAVYLVLIIPKSGGPWMQIVTDRPEARIPDASGMGARLQPNLAHTWQVSAYGPCANIDDAAAVHLCGARHPRNLPSEFKASSAGRSFTTKP